MPFEFESLSHGKIAFGFFNIETDMILLNQYFLFAEDFCEYVSQAVQTNENIFKASWEAYSFQNREDIGNLMGAIHRIDHSGFIGEVYRLYPFPKRQEDFKQNPDGFKTRALIESIIQKYALKMNLRFIMDQASQKFFIGEYLFDTIVFQKLIQYIWQGGLPQWKDKTRPEYVWTMEEAINQSDRPIFKNLFLREEG
ncbi:MAG: hypothetical protein FJ107_01110 [Deltaproteobacteria bacterium]|nr:hypothetical protein [Deltaproteobacteria bacterium]MBM4346710.1 hypothetical protein [Deltaproteobacteria bacterium]